MTGITKLVHKLEDEDGPFFTVGEVASRLKKSKDTIRRWIDHNPDLVPVRHKMVLNDDGYHVWLYTEGDIARMEEFSSNIRVGRPPKTSKEKA